MIPGNLYEGREQTKVKHFILREYLERFALIVGTFAKSITYIDCFSGPWNLRSQDFRDSSFAIAIDQLKRAKATLSEKGKDLSLRCMFLEKAWIEAWKEAGKLKIEGLKPRQRVPRLKA